MFRICFGADLYESNHCRSDVGDGRAIRLLARHCSPEMFSTNGGAGFKFSTQALPTTSQALLARSQRNAFELANRPLITHSITHASGRGVVNNTVANGDIG